MTKYFLEQAYPRECGWELTTEAHLLGEKLAFVLSNGQYRVLVPKVYKEPFVSRGQLASVRSLIKRFRQNNEDLCVQVLMVYKTLLSRPLHIADKDIVVFSLEKDYVPTQILEHHVYAN